MNASAAVAHYAPTLDALRPGCGEDERRRRCGVLFLRDRAAAAQREATWEAQVVLAAIESIATVHAFGPMAAAELETLHHGLIRLMMVARAFEMRGPGRLTDD